MGSPARQLQELYEAAIGENRYVDLCLVLRRAKTGEQLFVAGGKWDRIERRYLDDCEADNAVFIDLEESQVEFARWFATWIQAFREGWPRDTSLALLAGDRRAGKTFGALACVNAALIDVPEVGGSSTLGWVVSRNYQERDEIDKTFIELIPADWYTALKAPEFKYTFVNGATLRNVSADDPETLKRGRVDVALFNEAQKLPVAALSNGIYGTADKGGIAILAANSPKREVGEWIYELREGIREGAIDGARFFGFDSRFNTKINRPARDRIGGILRVLDPEAAKRDADNEWLPVGERAYPRFRRRAVDDEPGNLGAPPERGDITRDFLKRRASRAYDFVAGVDFQGTPHHAGVICKVFGPPTSPILWAIDEVLADHATEEDFLDEIDDKEYEPGSLLWIGDASGQWQDGRHDFSGGRRSFDIFKKRRWHIKPPRVKITDKGEFAKNPHIDDRLNLINQLLASGRIMIDAERCPSLADSIRECPLKNTGGKRKPYGRHSHVTDALGYVAFYLFGKVGPQRAPGTGPAAWSLRDARPSFDDAFSGR